MYVPRSSENCDKKFSTSFNENRHEKAKGHGPNDKLKTIPFIVAQDMYLLYVYVQQKSANIIEIQGYCKLGFCRPIPPPLSPS